MKPVEKLYEKLFLPHHSEKNKDHWMLTEEEEPKHVVNLCLKAWVGLIPECPELDQYFLGLDCARSLSSYFTIEEFKRLSKHQQENDVLGLALFLSHAWEKYMVPVDRKSYLYRWFRSHEALKIRVLEFEADIPHGTLQHFISCRRELNKEHEKKLLPILQKYGYDHTKLT